MSKLTDLEDNLNRIVEDRRLNLLPRNIKKDVTILGVDGILDMSGIDTSDANALDNEIIENKTAYVGNVKITGTMKDNGQLDYIPSTTDQVIPEGYTSGGTIKAVTSENIDPNIKPENIKDGIEILGVTGILTASGINTTDSDATAEDIVAPKSAYVNGQKVIGELEKKEIIETFEENVEISDDQENSKLLFNLSVKDKGAYDLKTKINSLVNYEELANAIGLSEDKIKFDETILGLTGTHVGQEINGKTKEYEVSPYGDINSGDFVSFIKGRTSEGWDTTGISEIRYASDKVENFDKYYYSDALELSENRYLVACVTNNTDNVNKLKLYICRIENGKIVFSKGQVIEEKIDSNNFDIVKISEERVLVSYAMRNTHGDFECYSVLYDIPSNMLIKRTTKVENELMSDNLNTQLYGNSGIKHVDLSNGNIVLVYNNKYAQMVIINLETIAFGNIYEINKEIMNTEAVSKLDASSIIILQSSANEIYATICSIENSIIRPSVKNFEIAKREEHVYSKANIVKISDTLFFITYTDYYENNKVDKLTAIGCTINSGVITKGNEFVINEYTAESLYANNNSNYLLKLSDSEIMVFHSNKKLGRINYNLCTINEDRVIESKVDDFLMSESIEFTPGLIFLNDKILYSCHSETEDKQVVYLFQCVDKRDMIKTYDDPEKDTILGIARTSGKYEDIIQVVIPNEII